MKIRSLLATLCVAVPTIAFAHGDAEWIMRDKGYVDLTDVHCCGPHDCRRAAAGEIADVPGGFNFKGTFVPYKDVAVYWSIDSSYWYCQREDESLPRCVFRPRRGTS